MTRGEKVAKFIETFCRVPEGAGVGEPLRLQHWQREFITAVYDNPAGTRRAILSVARKSGKTTLTAALLLAHLVGPEARRNSQIVSGAMSKEQAGIVFALAVKMVNLHPKLAELVKVTPSGKRLIGLPLNVTYQALAADGRTTQGLSPVLIIADEWGQVAGPNNPFIDSLLTSQGAHADPLLLVISTQAATDADWLSVQIDDALRGADPKIVCHLYTAPADCDLMDESAWRAANPALGENRSMDDLRLQMQQASRMPSMENAARNLLLNQRVAVTAPFVSPTVWKACGDEPAEFTGPVYGGLDLSARLDLTALVLYDHAGNVRAYFWTPEVGLRDREARDKAPYTTWKRQGFLRTTPGSSVDYGHVAADIADLLADLDIHAIAFDRWRIDVFKAECDRQGIALPLVPWGQGFKDMAPALDSLEAELLNGRIRHGMNPVLTMCAANAVVTKDPTGARKLDKAKATGRIDGLQALAMAVGVAGTAPAPEVAPDVLCAWL